MHRGKRNRFLRERENKLLSEIKGVKKVPLTGRRVDLWDPDGRGGEEFLRFILTCPSGKGRTSNAGNLQKEYRTGKWRPSGQDAG